MSKEIQIINNQSNLPVVATPIGNIDAYIQWANTIPLLSKNEETELAEKLHKNNDLAAAQKLVTAHLRYVIKVAKGYMGYGLMLGDLIQEGTIGLMKAVKRFQPKKGVRLVSFAIHWIKAEIHEFVLRNWKIVKIATTKAQRKLFFNLRNAKKHTGWLSQQEIKDIAINLNVKPKEVELMEKRLHANDAPFDLPSFNDSNYKNNKIVRSPVEYLETKNANPEKVIENNNWNEYTNKKLFLAFEKLDPRSKDILKNRWLNNENYKVTLQELADKYKISKERIRQLEKNAIENLSIAIQE